LAPSRTQGCFAARISAFPTLPSLCPSPVLWEEGSARTVKLSFCLSSTTAASDSYDNQAKILIEGCRWSLNLPSLLAFIIEVFWLDGKILGHSFIE